MFNPLEHPIIFSHPERLTSSLNWHEHLPFGMFLVSVLRPRVLVELGTIAGDSYCCFCQAVSEFGLDTQCYAVSTWSGQAGQNGDRLLADLRAYHDPRYGRFSHLLRSAFKEAGPQFADGSIDLLHIDGVQTDEAVRSEFEAWLPKVSDGGVILFHNTNVREQDFSVWKFWEEVRHDYLSFEFKHGGGLGVLTRRQAKAEALQTFFQAERAGPEHAEILRKLFCTLGQRIALGDENSSLRRVNERLSKEVAASAAELERLHVVTEELQNQITEQQGQISSYAWTVADLHAQTMNDALVRAGLGYRALLKARSLFAKAFPEASPQRAAYRQMRRLAKSALGRSASDTASMEQVEPAYSYEQWMEAHLLTPSDLEHQRQCASEFHYRPLISLLTPVYNTPLPVLREAIESVLNQSYDHWELCLADGASQDPAVREVLREYAARDPRIKFTLLDTNLGISGNSNAALSLASGDFVAIFDHDDLLAPNALFEVAAKLNELPETDIVYFDEDKVSADGQQRHSPWFKPGAWSPEMMLNANFLMHSVIRRSLVEQLGGFNPEMDGAQDWDMALRCTELTQRIAHVPKVLYHWRQVPTSASFSVDAKPWAFESQIRCITAYLERRGIRGARAEFPHPGELRVVLPASGAKVSIIIPTKDKLELLKPCLQSLLHETDYANLEVLLVDTGSKNAETWRYYETLRDESRLRLLKYPGRFNFSAVNNYAAQFATGDLLLFLNNDTQALGRDWLMELASWAEYPGVGVVGCKLIRPDHTIQHGGIIMGLAGHGSHIFDGGREHTYTIYGSTESYRNVQAVTGACMMMRRTVFDALGGFDEVYEIGYSDIEICLRALEQGYRIVYTPFARVLHHEGGTRGFSLPPADVLRATMQMQPWVRRGDPFFNPNLSTENRVPACKPPEEEDPETRLGRILQAVDLTPPGAKLIELPQPVAWPDVATPRHSNAENSGQLPRKLLIISHNLSLSGAPLILQKLARHLCDRGYELTVVAEKDGPLRAAYAADGIPVIIEPSLLLDARAATLLLPEYDAMLANTIKSWRSMAAARAAGKPSIWWIHETEVGRQEIRLFPRIADVLPTASEMIFPSQATAEIYSNWLRPDRHHVIHYGLDFAALTPQALPRQFSSSGVKIVHIGSVEPRKGQDLFLRAIAALPKDLLADASFWLIGRELVPEFVKKIKNSAARLKNVHLLGELPHEQTQAYLRQCDVFVCSSRDEALPITVLEAMGHGKAVVSTRAGGVGEVIVNGESGLLLSIDDHSALTNALARVIRDRPLRDSLGTKAQAFFAKELTWDRFAEAMEGLIAKTLSLPPV